MQIPLNIDLLQILLHIFNFVILAGGLTLLLFNPVAKFMHGREEEFAKREEEARRMTEEAARLKAEYERKLADLEHELAEKRAAAEREMADAARRTVEDAKARASELLSAAETDAETRKEHIMASVQTEIGELVLSAAQKLLSEEVTPERNHRLYDEFIRVAESTIAKNNAGNTTGNDGEKK